MNCYYSISQYPGTTGKYYYSWFFDKHGIDATYVPIGCDPGEFDVVMTDLLNKPDTFGISISMPYKTRVIKYCTTIASSVSDYNSCNTIVVNSSWYTGHNCDLSGVIGVISGVDLNTSISVLGNGAMGKMFYGYLQQSKYTNVKLYSRSMGNWEDRHTSTEIIINCTALGTSSSGSPLNQIPDGVTRVIDLSVNETELSHQCFINSVKYTGGMEFYRYQFIDQFKKYTGITIEPTQFEIAKNQR
jgi:shikimate 5-dehydrogenase